MKLEQLINEEVKKRINEAVVLNNEIGNLGNAAMILKGIYHRLVQQGMSKHEITMLNIVNIIQSIAQIQKRWNNMDVW